MSGYEAAILALAIFLGGVVLGVIGMVSLAIRKEDRRLSLAGPAPGVGARGARRLNGFGGRGIVFPARGQRR
jgi:hypothetical protein